MRKHIIQHISAESAVGDFAHKHKKDFLVGAYLTREVDMLLVLFKWNWSIHLTKVQQNQNTRPRICAAREWREPRKDGQCDIARGKHVLSQHNREGTAPLSKRSNHVIAEKHRLSDLFLWNKRYSCRVLKNTFVPFVLHSFKSGYLMPNKFSGNQSAFNCQVEVYFYSRAKLMLVIWSIHYNTVESSNKTTSVLPDHLRCKTSSCSSVIEIVFGN